MTRAADIRLADHLYRQIGAGMLSVILLAGAAFGVCSSNVGQVAF